MNDDLRIRSFKNKMINTMNDEPLPLEVKRLVLVDILNETSRAADESIKNAIQIAATEKSDSENSPE